MIKKSKGAISSGLDTDNTTDTDMDNEIEPIECKYYTVEQLNDKKFICKIEKSCI